MKKHSSIRTIYAITLVVVVSAVLTAFLSGPKSPAPRQTITKDLTSRVPFFPAPDPKVVEKTKPEILAQISSGKTLTKAEREEIILLLSANKIDYYDFTPDEIKLLITALNKQPK